MRKKIAISTNTKKLEDYEPGAAKSEVYEALKIASKPIIKPKPDSKKPS